MSKLISMDKKYKTRDGLEARVLCIDNYYLNSDFPVIALVEGETFTYTVTGGLYSHIEDDSDLIEVAQEHCVWVEVFKSHGDILSCSYESENAMRNSINDSFESNDKEGYQLIATKKIVVTDGEFCS